MSSSEYNVNAPDWNFIALLVFGAVVVLALAVSGAFMATDDNQDKKTVVIATPDSVETTAPTAPWLEREAPQGQCYALTTGEQIVYMQPWAITADEGSERYMVETLAAGYPITLLNEAAFTSKAGVTHNWYFIVYQDEAGEPAYGNIPAQATALSKKIDCSPIFIGNYVEE